MRIMINEMKKIWNLKVFTLVMVISIFFFLLFMEFYISSFPKSHPQIEEYDLSVELTREFGTTLEKDELDRFMEKRDELVSQAEEYISRAPIFAAAGIYDYEDYWRLTSSEDFIDKGSKIENEARWYLSGEECDYIQFKINALDSIIEEYNNVRENYEYRISQVNSSREALRLQELLDTDQYRGIMPDYLIENTSLYIGWLSVLVVLSTLVLLSPLLVNDKMRGVDVLQYTSRKGRKILKSQWYAVLISAFILATLQIAVAAAIYRIENIDLFWNNGLNSFMMGHELWFDMTFGQYIWCNIAMIYLCALGTAFISYIMSGVSQQYIQLILKLIPIFALITVLCKAVFNASFSMYNILYYLTAIVGIEFIACSIVFLVGYISCVFFIGKMKKVDI